MDRLRTLATLGAVAAISAAAHADTTWHQPGASSYVDFGSSPWAAVDGWGYFNLEDFEDGAMNTPGLSASIGDVRGPTGATDSVDGDGNGLLDGYGGNGYSFFRPDPSGAAITFSFDLEMLGDLPSHAGLVWTDGNAAALVTFEAFDDLGESIGSFETMLGDGIHNGSTAADRFLGVEFDGGIASMTISASFGSLELDHVQYGYQAPTPAPGALALLGAAGLFGRSRRRRG